MATESIIKCRLCTSVQHGDEFDPTEASWPPGPWPWPLRGFISCLSPRRSSPPRSSRPRSTSETSPSPLTRSVSASATWRVCFWTKPAREKNRRVASSSNLLFFIFSFLWTLHAPIIYGCSNNKKKKRKCKIKCYCCKCLKKMLFKFFISTASFNTINRVFRPVSRRVLKLFHTIIYVNSAASQ